MAIPFVGRDAELATLVDLVRRGHDAHAPAIAIVSAEPGRGKTRLLAETIALLPDVRTIRLAGFEPMEPIALGAASELLRGLSTVPVEGPILAALVHGGSTDLHSEPLRVFEAAHRALARLGPLRLTIDDLQWVDRPSLALIDYLIRAAESRRLRLTVLATGRPSAALTTFASRIENELPADRRVTLELGPLTRDAGSTLALAIDPRLTAGAAADLWRRSTGSPFWLELLARSPSGGDQSTAIGERLRGLGRDAARLLAALSVAGRPIGVEALDDLLGWPERRVVGAAHELVTIGLAVESVGGLRPVHDLIREAALNELPQAERRRLEGRLADAIERDANDDVLQLREALVHQHAAGRPSSALALRLVTARQSRLLNVEDLQFLVTLSDEMEPGRAEQVGLDQGLATLAAHAGALSLAIERWTRVATHAPDPTTRQEAQVGAAQAAYQAGRGEAVNDWLDRATREAPVGPEMSIRIDAIRADTLLWIDHESLEGSRVANRAVESAERLIRSAGGLAELPLESRRAYLSALEAAGDGALQLGHADEIVRLAEATVRVAGQIDDEAAIAALNRAAFANRPLGRMVEAERLSRRAWDESRRLILPSAMVEAGHSLSRTLRDLGRVEEAHRIAVETVEIESRLQNPSRRWGNAPNVLHVIELCLQDPVAGLDRIREDARLERDPHYRLAVHQEIATWLARTVGARAAAEIVTELDAAQADSLLARCPRCAVELTFTAAALLARIGHVDRAAELMTPDAVDLPEGHVLRWVRMTRARAELALARGDHPTATELLGAVVERLSKAGLLEDLVWSWLDLGRANLTVDRDAAVAAFAKAADLAETIGAPTHGRIASRALRGLGIRTWRRRATAIGRTLPGNALGRLSEREREVAALVADGRSNREIAASFEISPKTVERHLTNMLAKLGVRNRTELATLVRSGPVRDFPDE
ncbi:MAG: LuxR C-terminal-related transcriptional regulator [Candidatus Limnocylindrales bacterium]